MSHTILKEFEIYSKQTSGEIKMIATGFICRAIMYLLFCFAMIYYINYSQYQESAYNINNQFMDFFERTPFHSEYGEQYSHKISIDQVSQFHQVFSYLKSTGQRVYDQKDFWNKNYDDLYQSTSLQALVDSNGALPDGDKVYLNANTRLIGAFRLLHF